MSSTAADTADNVSCKITLFLTVEFTMSNTTAVLTDLVFIVAERAIQGRKFAKLISFVVVLAFGCGRGLNRKARTLSMEALWTDRTHSYRLDDFVNEPHASSNFLV